MEDDCSSPDAENESSYETMEQPQILSRMSLNDNKAGMQGLDKAKINKIIHDNSVGSKFYENERKKDAMVNERIKKLLEQMSQITPEQMDAAYGQTNVIIEELEKSRDLSRTIVHVDMDAFYASVEERDKPELKNKPMAVGGMDMLSTSNYAARKYGVRAAMPGFIGKKLCPELVLVPLNFSKYREVSKNVREVLKDYDPNFCPMGLDEAYLDITKYLETRKVMSEEERTFTCDNISKDGTDSDHCVVFGVSAEDVVQEMRFRIELKTRLTASAGIAPNALLAKVASDMNKPNGQFILEPSRESVLSFVKGLSIRKVTGVGKVTEKLLNALGVKTCSDLYEKRALLFSLFSSTMSNHFLRISIGIGSTVLVNDSERKSISIERTFHNISKPEVMYKKCEELCDGLEVDAKNAAVQGYTVTLKIKLATFELHTRSKTLLHPVSTKFEVFPVVADLLRQELALKKNALSLRLIGVGLSKLTRGSRAGRKQKSLDYYLQKSNQKAATNSPEICRTGSSNKENDDSLSNGDKPDPSVAPISSENCNIDISDNEESDIFNDCTRLLPDTDILPSEELITIGTDCHTSDNDDSTDGVSSCFDENLATERVELESAISDKSNPSIEEVNPSSLVSTSKTCNFGISSSSSSGNTSATAMTCPVCNATFCAEDITLSKFNNHLDSCLNRKAVIDLVRSESELYESETTPRAKKRKYPQKLSGPSRKKCTQHTTLDMFLSK